MPRTVHAKTRPTQDSDSEVDAAVDQAVADAGADAQADAVLAATDELLDEIDACLEDNALEVVTRYRQKGGQ